MRSRPRIGRAGFCRSRVTVATRAVAGGGDFPSLLAALQHAEHQRQSFSRAALACDAPARDGERQERQKRDLKSQVLAKVAAWRTTLRQDAPDARQILRRLIANRISLEAVIREGDRRD